jgi:hypothetical protein
MADTNTAPTASQRLVHGDLALAQRLERAEGRANAEFVDARQRAFPETNGRWIEAAGALAMFDGVDSPCTQTFGLGLNGPVSEAELAHIEEFFLSRGAHVDHEVCSLADWSLLELLPARGYRPIEMSSVVCQPIVRGLELCGMGVSIRVRPITPSEHELWARVSVAGWADAAPGLDEYLLSLARANPYRERSHYFLAEIDGAAIATGAMSLFDGVALLAGASTIPQWRKRGAQSALLAARLRFAVENGCDLAMMAAQPGSGSQRNAERQGFRLAYTRTKWRKQVGASEKLG